MIKITLKNINIEELISFFVSANIGEKQIIDILNYDGVLTLVSHGHTKTKDFVKSLECDLLTTCEDVISKQEISHVKMPFIDIKKVIELLRIYSKDSDVDINLSCKVVDDTFVVHCFEMKSKKKTTKLRMADVSLVQYLSNDVWKVLVNDVDVLSTFEISEFDVTDIKKLLRFESESQSDLKVKESRKFRIKFMDGLSKISSYDDNWEIDVQSSGDYNGDNVFPSIIFQNISLKDTFTCQYVRSKSRGIKYLIVSNVDIRTTYVIISEEYKK